MEKLGVQKSNEEEEDKRLGLIEETPSLPEASMSASSQAMSQDDINEHFIMTLDPEL